jgi:hypothetical protein
MLALIFSILPSLPLSFLWQSELYHTLLLFGRCYCAWFNSTSTTTGILRYSPLQLNNKRPKQQKEHDSNIRTHLLTPRRKQLY